MAAKRQRRQYKRRPGLGTAAVALGVTISHARRVWIGERRSPALLKELRERIRQQRAARKTLQREQPGATQSAIERGRS
jgi:hypothetical protein